MWTWEQAYSATTVTRVTGQSDCRTRTMNFNQSRLNQLRVDGNQQLKPPILELFTVGIIMLSDWLVISDLGHSSRTVVLSA